MAESAPACVMDFADLVQLGPVLGPRQSLAIPPGHVDHQRNHLRGGARGFWT